MKTTIGSQFQTFIVSVLESYGLQSSRAAVTLLVMIAAHESGGLMYVKQMHGSARGLFQMEPVAVHDVQRYLNERPEKFASVLHYIHYNADHLIFDSVSAVVFARIYLMMDPEPLPNEHDLWLLAKYAKRRWNTDAGNASVDDYYDAFLQLTA